MSQPKSYVLARLKPLAEIPKQFVCCDAMIQRFVDGADVILKAFPDKRFVAEIECQFCHRILDNVGYVKIKRDGAATCIAAACYEFDEGFSGAGVEKGERE